jgi:hypothetical protein
VTLEPDPDAEWWTTSDVATYLGVRVGTVSSYRLRDRCLSRTSLWGPHTCGGPPGSSHGTVHLQNAVAGQVSDNAQVAGLAAYWHPTDTMEAMNASLVYLLVCHVLQMLTTLAREPGALPGWISAVESRTRTARASEPGC